MNKHGTGSANISPWPTFFTQQKTFELLREILKGDDPLPSQSGLPLQTIVEYLNIIRWRTHGWNGPWERHHDECQKIADALGVLLEILPSHRESVAAEVRAAERWEHDPKMSAEFPAGLAEARGHVAAMDALIAAAATAYKRGLPLAHMMNVMSAPARRWQDVAPDLKRIFQTALPRCSDAAAYRFIEAVVPDITNERPTFETVKDAFKPSKPKRLVNRGGRFS